MKQKDTIEKRFIAGATCPSCGSLDCLLLYYNEANVATRECVDCGYLEAFQDPNLESASDAVENAESTKGAIQRISIKEL